jgi:NADPH2:quinone reductase
MIDGQDRRMAMHWVATDFGDLGVLELQQVDVPAPSEGEVSIAVHAAGMNPADYKHIAREGDRARLPIPIGYEVSGVLTAIGSQTEIASGAGEVGDEVLAFRVTGGYATALTVPATDVFAKPGSMSHPAAANLLLAGTTAAEMLHVTRVTDGDTIVVHGASGAVGVSVLQQAALLGARVIGTASPNSFDTVRTYGGEPVAYGEGLEERLRDVAPDGYAAALDTVGSDEAVDVSLAVVEDRSRIVTIAAFDRATSDGITAIGGAMPASAAYRDANRSRLIALAAAGRLVVPVARTFPLTDAIDALTLLKGGHPGGKLALAP